MSAEEYLNEMKTIQNFFLNYINNEANVEENYQNLIQILDDIKIYENQHKVKSLFYLTIKISNNHYRGSDFFNKIEKILLLFKDKMKKYFSNSELFHIFKSNKRLLLFLFEENIMVMDEFIVKNIINNRKYIKYKYPQFFQPEIQPFIHEEWFQKYEAKEDDDEIEEIKLVEELKKELPNNFHEKRKIGENDDYICFLIQKDSIEDFITSINKNPFSVNSTINSSIYETNNYLLKKQSSTSLIEYAAFYGSIQIFNYLRLNNVTLRQSLWLYTIHGKNAELIHLLEQDGIKPVDLTYKKCVKESLKCHCNDIVNYFKDNFLKDAESNSQNILDRSLKYYNFQFISNIDKSSFYSLCHYDYYTFVDILLKKKVININETQILK